MLMPAPQLSEIMRKVQQVELRALKALDSTQNGPYRSVFRGQGMEFDQIREYTPGDDVRHIDWNAMARTGRPFVKVHIEERELTVLIALDVSASADFGTVGSTKREQMAELAAVLTFAALRGNDRIGLVLFTDEVELCIPPGKGRDHGLQIIRAVLSHHPSGSGTALEPALKKVQELVQRRAVVFLLSDFFTDESEESLETALRVASYRHELVAMRVTDPLEEQLPDVGLLAMADSETGAVIEIDTSDARVRARYAALASERREQLSQRLRRVEIELIELSTARDFTPQLADFFRTRTRVRR